MGVKPFYGNDKVFDNKTIYKYCYVVNGYPICVSRRNTTIHRYLTVGRGTSLLGNVPAGFQKSFGSFRIFISLDGLEISINTNFLMLWIRIFSGILQRAFALCNLETMKKSL